MGPQGLPGIQVKLESADTAHVCLERGLLGSPYTQGTMETLGHSHNASNLLAEVTKSEDNIRHTSLQPFFTVYQSVDQIQYTPEAALKDGIGMARSIKTGINTLRLGGILRQEVWEKELNSLTSYDTPTTLIAVCGATGAGKSSILNAILDGGIVPTSGMRACTAVVTEIAYHNKSTIDADVSFLSEAEWRAELATLLTDMMDENGDPKRMADIKSDAGIAWQKVHAVYPSIPQGQLVTMTVDQIIAYDQKMAQTLGTVQSIVAENSEIFAKEITVYIDSKDQKRGNKKGGKAKNSKGPGGETTTRNEDVPTLWPLIRQVNVRCNAAVLSSGATLVDLPGVADANAARNNIAKDYMKKCNYIWILAPITRAVDDKTARDLLGDAFRTQLMITISSQKELLVYLFADGNYDDHAITFIASKCDDVSCSEIIRALRLEDDPDLDVIEGQLDECDIKVSQWKESKFKAKRNVTGITKELEGLRKHIREYKAHVKALAESSTAKLTTEVVNKATTTIFNPRKRRNTTSHKHRTSKRRCSSIAASDDFSMDSDNLDSNTSSDAESASSHSDRDSQDESEQPGLDTDSSADDNEGSEEGQAEVTLEFLQDKIQETRKNIKSANERLNKAKKQMKHATDVLATLEQNIAKVQREKNSFCSLKRSEFSRNVLKEDFRIGLKELDDAAAEERDPDKFDPNEVLRDYDAIDLPVFTCSSRDYIRLKGQVKGDGEAGCFSNVADTGIPDLQKWCHQLTASSRERSAKDLLAHLRTFTTTVQSYVQGIGDVTAVDREALRERWESYETYNHPRDNNDCSEGWIEDDDPFAVILGQLVGGMNPQADAYSRPAGIAPRLGLEFTKLINQCVEDLQAGFRNGLEKKCRDGAAIAAGAAVTTSDEFASSMYWSTYRATLRRYGIWRRDLNVELTTPFTRTIAHSWSQVFESDLFGPFGTAVLNSINNLLEDVERSASPNLKDHTRIQGERCLEEAHIALKKTLDVVQETVHNEQKEVSRSIALHVQNHLIDGYEGAMVEVGKGSVARQKASFHGFIENCKDDIFNGGADVLMNRLASTADAVGVALDESLGQLVQKIEVNLSVLWEGTDDDPDQIRIRKNLVTLTTEILQLIQLWTGAEKAKDTADAI